MSNRNRPSVRVPLTRGKWSGVDYDDAARVFEHKWQAVKDGRVWYAQATVNGTTIRMHRFVLRAPKGSQVDHRNGHGLDNRRENLRYATYTQNHANQQKTRGTSRYKGVWWAAHVEKWGAQVHVNNRGKHLGYFDDEKKAALAYDRAAVESWGEFARCNFPRATDRHFREPTS